MRDNLMIFADESGTDNNHKCYSIGAIKLSISQYIRILQGCFLKKSKSIRW